MAIKIINRLPYRYNSLEPYIDSKTMKIHYTKHHQSYIKKFNTALKNYKNLQKKSPEELIKNLNRIPKKIRMSIRNNGGGHVNHSFFWTLLKKNVKPKNEILEEINKKFGNFEKFKKEFTNKSITLFGSGWTWLVVNNKKLEITTTFGHDNPLSKDKIPILVLDLWEHAYYLKYQNKKAEYIKAFFHIINWERVNENFVDALKK